MAHERNSNMTTQEFIAELDWHVRHRGYSDVMGDVMGILDDLAKEDFVGNGPYWGTQAKVLRQVVWVAPDKKEVDDDTA